MIHYKQSNGMKSVSLELFLKIKLCKKKKKKGKRYNHGDLHSTYQI